METILNFARADLAELNTINFNITTYEMYIELYLNLLKIQPINDNFIPILNEHIKLKYDKEKYNLEDIKINILLDGNRLLKDAISHLEYEIIDILIDQLFVFPLNKKLEDNHATSFVISPFKRAIKMLNDHQKLLNPIIKMLSYFTLQDFNFAINELPKPTDDKYLEKGIFDYHKFFIKIDEHILLHHAIRNLEYDLINTITDQMLVSVYSYYITSDEYNQYQSHPILRFNAYNKLFSSDSDEEINNIVLNIMPSIELALEMFIDYPKLYDPLVKLLSFVMSQDFYFVHDKLYDKVNDDNNSIYYNMYVEITKKSLYCKKFNEDLQIGIKIIDSDYERFNIMSFNYSPDYALPYQLTFQEYKNGGKHKFHSSALYCNSKYLSIINFVYHPTMISILIENGIDKYDILYFYIINGLCRYVDDYIVRFNIDVTKLSSDNRSLYHFINITSSEDVGISMFKLLLKHNCPITSIDNNNVSVKDILLILIDKNISKKYYHNIDIFDIIIQFFDKYHKNESINQSDLMETINYLNSINNKN